MSESILTFSEDISDAPAPPLLPAGPYPAEIIGATRRQGAAGEYAQITIRINAESYPADFTDGDPDGITLQYNFLQDSRHTAEPSSHGVVFMEKCGGPMGRNIDLNALIGLTAPWRSTTVHRMHFAMKTACKIARILAA